LKKKYIKRNLLTHIIVTLLIATLALPVAVGATPATRERYRQLQEQLNTSRQSVREQQSLLTGTRHEMSRVMAEIQDLDQKILDAQEALEEIELSLLNTEIQSTEAKEALDAARDDYDRQFEVLRTRVRVLHEHGTVGFLDIVFQAESIWDFLARWEYVRAVAQFDRELLNNFERAEGDIEARVIDLARWTNLIEDLQFQYNRSLSDLEFTKQEKAVFFEKLAEDTAKFEEVLAVLESERQMVESAFGDITAQLKKEESQIARQRAEEQHNARLALLNNFDGQFAWPVPTHSRISSGFGMRNHPILRVNRMHHGIDIGAPAGTRLIAAAEGYVRFAGWSGGYGNTVIIDHGNSFSTLYAHNSRNRVKEGERVTRGQHIADIGSTGLSTGPHVHFEIRINNTAVDPMKYYPD